MVFLDIELAASNVQRMTELLTGYLVRGMVSDSSYRLFATNLVF